MNTNERTTPESDKEEQSMDSGWGSLGDTFRTMRKLERERDEAREKLAELEKQLAEMQNPKAGTFEAHGLTWIKHVPGDPMPCDGNAKVRVIFNEFTGSKERDCDLSDDTASGWFWGKDLSHTSPICGWNYADAP